MKWFRLYPEAMRNPKVAALTDRDFRLWVNLLAVASENEGWIPGLEALKHLLKARLDHLSTGVERLISTGLIDRLAGGYEPHNWKKFQYKSDTSTERVAKHREKGNVSVTPPDSEQIQTQIFPKGNTRVRSPRFDEFWQMYPNKIGKPKAEQAFSKAALRADQQTIMDGLSRYLAKTDDRQWCNPATWLNQDRWADQPAAVARGSPSLPKPTFADKWKQFGEYADARQNSDDGLGIQPAIQFLPPVSGK